MGGFMRGGFCLAVFTASLLVFSQHAWAQDEYDECADVVASNMSDPDTLTRLGMSPGTAGLFAALHGSLVLKFATLVSLQRELDNLELLEPLFNDKSGKGLQILNKIRENIRVQMLKLREELNNSAEILMVYARGTCRGMAERADEAARRRVYEQPTINLGVGIGVGDGDRRDGHRERRRGGKHKKGSDDWKWQDPNSQQQPDNQQQGGEDHPHPGCGPQ